MMGFGLLWIVLLAAVVAYLLGWRPETLNIGGSRERSAEKNPLEITRERYARGEITRDEYREIQANLER